MDKKSIWFSERKSPKATEPRSADFGVGHLKTETTRLKSNGSNSCAIRARRRLWRALSVVSCNETRAQRVFTRDQLRRHHRWWDLISRRRFVYTRTEHRRNDDGDEESSDRAVSVFTVGKVSHTRTNVTQTGCPCTRQKSPCSCLQLSLSLWSDLWLWW